MTSPLPLPSLLATSSKTWQQISASERQALQEGEGTFKEDGEFWMSFDDFTKHYTDFEICNVSVAMLYEDDSGECCSR